MVSGSVRVNTFRGRNHSCEEQEAACAPLCTSAFQQEPLPATDEHSLSLLPGRHVPRGDAGPVLHSWLNTLSLRKIPLMESQNHFSWKRPLRLWKQQIAQPYAAEENAKIILLSSPGNSIGIGGTQRELPSSPILLQMPPLKLLHL